MKSTRNYLIVQIAGAAIGTVIAALVWRAVNEALDKRAAKQALQL